MPCMAAHPKDSWVGIQRETSSLAGGRPEPWGTVLVMVSLRPISESNREAVEALRVSPAQEQDEGSLRALIADTTRVC